MLYTTYVHQAGFLARYFFSKSVSICMQAAGYEYVNIDGGWWAGVGTGHAVRNASGYLEVAVICMLS